MLQTIFPAFFIAITLSIINSVPKLDQPGAKTIDISKFSGCVTFFQEKEPSVWMEKYASELTKKTGLNAICNGNTSNMKKLVFLKIHFLKLILIAQ